MSRAPVVPPATPGNPARALTPRYAASYHETINGRATRYPLVRAVAAFDLMDPLDALNDAKCLLAMQEQRCNELERFYTEGQLALEFR